MANQDIHEPLDFSEELRTLEPSDLGHADTFNPLFKRLINNDAFLKAMQDALAEEIGVVDQKVMTHEADLVTDSDGAHGLKVESGVFTPYLYDGEDMGNYSEQIGTYYRVGNRVFIDISLSSNFNYGAGSSQISLRGLPFRPKTVSSFSIGLQLGFNVESNLMFTILSATSGSFLVFRYQRNADLATVFVTRNKISSVGFELKCSGSYEI